MLTKPLVTYHERQNALLAAAYDEQLAVAVVVVSPQVPAQAAVPHPQLAHVSSSATDNPRRAPYFPHGQRSRR